jgi:uncharacterized protein (TIGR01777 family)
MDNQAVQGVDYIVHLSGANLGGKRWTSRRKEEIIRSRSGAANLLHKAVSEQGINLKAFISASGISYYGTETSDVIFREEDPAGKDFLSEVCEQWEQAANLFEADGIRTVKIRTAVVLEKSDSALIKMTMPAKFGFLISTGSGDQYLPWIHIDDICQIYLRAIEDQEMKGAYNASAPDQVNHNQFMKVLSKVMKKPLLPVSVPGCILKLIYGEMADLVLKGSRVSSEKLVSSGYSFLFPRLEDALNNVFRKDE